MEVDIFSLGIVIFSMIMLDFPFEKDVYKLEMDENQLVKIDNKRYSFGLKNTVILCLAKVSFFVCVEQM
jgi:hypothetical protein